MAILFDLNTPFAIYQPGDPVRRAMLNQMAFFFRFLKRMLSVTIERLARSSAFGRRSNNQSAKDERESGSIGPSARISVPSEHALDENTLIYAVGDIHGRADLLSDLLGQIERDATGFVGDVHIVFLGDYIDRGFQSRQVIDILLGERVKAFQAHFIKGNHEDAILSFISDPSFGPKWATYGGRETLVSYGIKPPKSMSLNEEWKKAHDDFLKACPRTHQTFLRTLPTRVKIGGYGFVHAGMKPGKDFAEQEDHDLMWIRDEFLSSKSTFDVVVVHGHTPTDVPHHDHRRINVDTGAYFTGRLTAVKLTSDVVEFLATGA
ncbi:MAG: metallophosphoesterase family protein [Pseudomonadota bacterium]